MDVGERPHGLREPDAALANGQRPAAAQRPQAVLHRTERVVVEEAVDGVQAVVHQPDGLVQMGVGQAVDGPQAVHRVHDVQFALSSGAGHLEAGEEATGVVAIVGHRHAVQRADAFGVGGDHLRGRQL